MLTTPRRPVGWPARTARRRLATLVPSDERRRPPARLEAWLTPRLAAADLDGDPASVVRWCGGALVAAAVLGGAVGPVAAVVVPLLLAAAAIGALRSAGGRREARRERELPALLEAVARSLRSGAAVPVALREAAASGSLAAEDLTQALAEVDAGLGLGEALDRWVQRRPHRGVRLVVGALAVATGSGGAPARAVDGVAATLRERGELEREVRALATQARASAVVITVAPLAFGALGVLGDERTAAFLLGTPAGLACLTAGVVFDIVGAWWMARIAGGPT